MKSKLINKEHNRIILSALSYLEQMSSALNSMDEYDDLEEDIKQVKEFVKKSRKFVSKDEAK